MADATQSPKPSSRKPLTAERLRELVHYDPVTDVWTRRGGHRPGKIDTKPDAKGRVKFWVDGVQYLANRLRFLYIEGRWPDGYMRPPKPAQSVPPATKTCRRCGVTKPFEEFAKEKSCRFGRRNTCLRCAHSRVTAWKNKRKTAASVGGSRPGGGYWVGDQIVCSRCGAQKDRSSHCSGQSNTCAEISHARRLMKTATQSS